MGPSRTGVGKSSSHHLSHLEIDDCLPSQELGAGDFHETWRERQVGILRIAKSDLPENSVLAARELAPPFRRSKIIRATLVLKAKLW
jgi:hypothetical protein